MHSTKTTVLISGANTGIGLAVATSLAKNHNYHTILGSRSASAGQAAASALVADGYSASSVQLDVSSDESITAAVDSLERDFGVLHVLINNAGVLLDRGVTSVEDHKLSTRELFAQTFTTNVLGVACLTEACLPLLRKSEAPRLVFV